VTALRSGRFTRRIYGYKSGNSRREDENGRQILFTIIRSRKNGTVGLWDTHEGDEKGHTKFQLEKLKEMFGITGFLDCVHRPVKWRRYVPLIHRLIFTGLHCVMSHPRDSLKSSKQITFL
jgi:hypothetical protein